MNWKKRLRENMDIHVEQKPFQKNGWYYMDEDLVPVSKNRGHMANRITPIALCAVVLFVASFGYFAFFNTPAADNSDDIAAADDITSTSAETIDAEETSGTEASQSAPGSSATVDSDSSPAVSPTTSAEPSRTTETTAPMKQNTKYAGCLNLPWLDPNALVLPSGRIEMIPQYNVQLTDTAMYYCEGDSLYRRDNTSGKVTLINDRSASSYILTDNEDLIYYFERDDDFRIDENTMGMRFRLYKHNVSTAKKEKIYSFIGGLWSAVYYEGYIYCGIRLDDNPKLTDKWCLIRISPDTGEVATLFQDTADFFPYVFNEKLYMYRFRYHDGNRDLDKEIHQVYRLDADGRILQTMLDVSQSRDEGKTLYPNIFITDSALYISDSTAVYCVNPDKPDVLKPLYKAQNNLSLILAGTTKSHLYFVQQKNISGSYYVYSFALKTSQVKKEWESKGE